VSGGLVSTNKTTGDKTRM